MRAPVGATSSRAVEGLAQNVFLWLYVSLGLITLAAASGGYYLYRRRSGAKRPYLVRRS